MAELRGFNAKDFGNLHPAGSLGKRLNLTLADLYITNAVPKVYENATLQEIILEISEKRMGATVVLDKNENLIGIITDGDLRRMLMNKSDFLTIKASQIMTYNPKKMYENENLHNALELMENNNISQLVVINENEKYLGLVHLHDLVKLGLNS